MFRSYDLIAALVLFGAISLALGAYLGASLVHGRPLVASRVEREMGLPLVGKMPMHAVYRALEPMGRLLIALGISANAITLASVVIALGAGAAFATGHFGVAAIVGAIASLADGLDGFVARLTGTQSRYGQVLDTTLDRYVDAIFIGGIALFVHENIALLGLTLAALVGSFMVSYASSVERELAFDAGPARFRRAHRLVFLLLASAVAPIAAEVLGPRAELPVVFVAVVAIGVAGNLSAVRRLLRAAAHESVASPAAAKPNPAREAVESEAE